MSISRSRTTSKLNLCDTVVRSILQIGQHIDMQREFKLGDERITFEQFCLIKLKSINYSDYIITVMLKILSELNGNVKRNVADKCLADKIICLG